MMVGNISVNPDMRYRAAAMIVVNIVVILAGRLSGFGKPAQDCRKPIRNAPQWRPRMKIGEETSFISTKLPPPMSRR
jgi:hypothetical protein